MTMGSGGGFGNIPAPGLPAGTPGMRAGRLVQLLQGMPNSNNGTHLGGLGSVLAKALMGYAMSEEQAGVKKAETDRQEATKALIGGMTPRPAMVDAPGPNMDGTAGVNAPAYGGGFEGGVKALQGLQGNEYAGKLTQDLMMGQLQRMQALEDARTLQREKPRDPFRVGPGEKLLDPNDPTKVLAEGGPRPEASPQSVREYEFAKANGFPGSYMDFTRAQRPASSVQSPSAIQEYEFFQRLNPEQQQRYLLVKRANPYVNTGDAMIQPNPMVPGQPIDTLPKGLPPDRKIEDGRVITLPGVPGQAPALVPGGLAPQIPGQQPNPLLSSTGGPPFGPATVQLPPSPKEAQTKRDAIADAQYTYKLVDDLVKHKGFKDVVGGSMNPAGWAANLGVPIPGTDAAGFVARLDQLGGRQFLEAFDRLKGAGQITEVEGTKATNALSRLMKTGQKEEEYIAAANELKDILRNTMIRNSQGLTPEDLKKLPSVPGMNGGPREGSAATPATINSDEQYDALPSGSHYVGPDGLTRRKL